MPSASLPSLSPSLFASGKHGPIPFDTRGPVWSRQEARKKPPPAAARPATSECILREERRCPADVLLRVLPGESVAASSKESVRNAVEHLRRANCFPHARDASWLLRERVRPPSQGGLEALIPPSKQKKKPKPKEEVPPATRRIQNMRVEFDQIFSEDIIERELAILKITDYTKDQVVELREMIWSTFPELRGIFFTYARMEMSVAQAKMLSEAIQPGPNDMETLSKVEFFKFCKDCKLFDNKFFTMQIAELLFMAVNRANNFGFEKHSGELARSGARRGSTPNNERRGSTPNNDRRGSTPGNERRGSTANERRGSTPPAVPGMNRRASKAEVAAGDRERRSEEADSEDVFTLSEFLSALIRISFLKYGTKMPDLALRLRHLLTRDILPNARQENKDFFRKILIEPGVYEVVRSYRRALFSIFSKYAAADATDTLLQGAAYSEKLNLKEFVRVFEDAELIGSGGIALRQVREAFALAQAELGDEVADLTGHGAVVEVEADDDSTQMDFNEFIEGVCRCADVRAGSPSENVDDTAKRKLAVSAAIRSFLTALLRGLGVQDPFSDEPPSPRHKLPLPLAARGHLKPVPSARRLGGATARSRIAESDEDEDVDD